MSGFRGGGGYMTVPFRKIPVTRRTQIMPINLVRPLSIAIRSRRKMYPKPICSNMLDLSLHKSGVLPWSKTRCVAWAHSMLGVGRSHLVHIHVYCKNIHFSQILAQKKKKKKKILNIEKASVRVLSSYTSIFLCLHVCHILYWLNYKLWSVFHLY